MFLDKDLATSPATSTPAPEAPTETPAPAPAAEAPTSDAKSKDVVDNDSARLFAERFLNRKPKTEPAAEEKPKEAASEKKPKAKKAEKTERVEPSGDPEPTPEPKAEKKESKPGPEKSKDLIDYEKLGKSVRDAIKTEERPARRDAASEEPPQLPSKEQKKIAYLMQMEAANPERYKDIAVKYEQGLRASADYQSKWEKENPGEKFDKADPAHDEFFNKHAVDWDDDDYTEAVAAAKAREVRLELEAEARRRDMEPEVRKAGAATAKTFLEELGGKTAAAALLPDGTLDEDRWKEFAEVEPIKAKVLASSAAAAQSITTEIERLFSGAVEFQPNNPTHRNLSQFALSAENAMKSRPESEREHDGKMFATARELSEMSPAQKAKHWTFSSQDLRYLALQDIKSDTEKLIAEQEKEFAEWAKRKGLREKEKAEEPEKPAKTLAKPVSPTATVEPKMTGVKGTAASAKEEAVSRWENRFLGKTMAT